MKEYGRIHRSYVVEQGLFQNPVPREIGRTVEINPAALHALRNHVNLAAVFKDVWIGKMVFTLQRDLWSRTFPRFIDLNVGDKAFTLIEWIIFKEDISLSSSIDTEWICVKAVLSARDNLEALHIGLGIRERTGISAIRNKPVLFPSASAERISRGILYPHAEELRDVTVARDRLRSPMNTFGMSHPAL